MPGNRQTGRRQRRVLLLVLGHQPHRPRPQLGINLLRHETHPSNSQRCGIKPGAVHYQEFNPTQLDPVALARQARDMGARYVIVPTKHHDGFCLWPSRFTEHTVAPTPYGEDIVGQFVSAYDAENIDVFLYFSVLEWTNPDYVEHAPHTDDERRRFDRFLQYTRNQLLELTERYPSIKGFWFDGTWDESWSREYEFTYALERELRAAVPGLIIGSRFRADEHGSRHFDSTGRLLGDYEQGWERKLPPSFELLEGHDWDCVTSIPPNGWAYLKNIDGLYLKTADDLIDLLMRCRSMNGNLVINFGPDGQGRIRPEENEIAAALAQWTRTNEDAIYPGRHVPIPRTPLGHLTRSDRTLYLTVVNRPVNDIVRLTFPKDSSEVPVEARILGTEGQVAVRHTDIGFDLDPYTYYDIRLPHDFTSTHAFVIAMTLGDPPHRAAHLMDAAM
nr:alpha-L-fucosidase [Flexivirga oryzae]